MVVVPHPGRVVTQSQIKAIVHLVSSSVPYLPSENVSVVDNTGALLTDTAGENAMTLTTAQAEHKRSLEMSYNRRIEQILASIVGMGNVRSEVDVTLDFTEVETTYEEFDKSGVGPRTRSESLDFEQDAAIGASGLPGSFPISHRPPRILRKPETYPKAKKARLPAACPVPPPRATTSLIARSDT